jgi:hypothetical protein
MLVAAAISLHRVRSPALGLVPVHIGQPEPGSQQQQAQRRPQRVPGGLDWQKHGLQPRWLGMETSDCAVALNPQIYASYGASERDRFLAGAQRRGELALVVAAIGNINDDSPRSPLSSFDSSVYLGDIDTSVASRRLPQGTRPEMVPGPGRADRDLALRLLSRRADAPWWSLHLSGSHLLRGDGSGEEYHEPEGQLQPILVDALGDPVAAVWIPAAGDQRWYIIPDATDWDSILDWLIQRTLPEYVPTALRRARSPHFADPDLQTAHERAARQSLEDLDARHADERLPLEQALNEAEARAEPVRYGLLYGTGDELVQAVAQVLADAGLRTVDLDEELGATRSADLLVSADGPSWCLVEVKSASGAAPEQLVGHLERHLATWPQLRPEQPVTGGVLIVNHQHRQHPSERTAQVYSRPEFVAALPVTVVSTVELFGWWRTENWTAIRTTILGAEGSQGTPVKAPSEVAGDPSAPADQRRRWWSGRQAR